MKTIYKLEQRVAFIARNEVACDGKVILGLRKYCKGYIKQIRRSLLGVRYVIQIPKTYEIHIVRQRDVLGVADYHEDNPIKSNKSTDNDSI